MVVVGERVHLRLESALSGYFASRRCRCYWLERMNNYPVEARGSGARSQHAAQDAESARLIVPCCVHLVITVCRRESSSVLHPRPPHDSPAQCFWSLQHVFACIDTDATTPIYRQRPRQSRFHSPHTRRLLIPIYQSTIPSPSSPVA